MRPVLTEERWQAARDLFEVYGVPYRPIAVLADANLSTVRSHGRQHNWVPAARALEASAESEDAVSAVDAAAAETMVASLAGPGERAAFLASQVDALLQAALRGRLDRRRIDATLSMLRLVEKAAELSRDAAAEQQTRSDDQLADILQRTNARIVELAEELAERLVADAAERR